MNWVAFAGMAAVCFGSYNLFMKLSADRISPTVALLFIAGTSFIVALSTTLFLKFTGQPLNIDRSGLIYPILAGLSTGVAEILYLIMFSKNTPVSIGAPLVLASTLVVGVLFGLLFLREGISAGKFVGIVITIIGIIILARY